MQSNRKEKFETFSIVEHTMVRVVQKKGLVARNPIYVAHICMVVNL
jgi:hypothetical protein